MRPVVLTGLPGSGKSTVAPRLAHTLRCAFQDLDTAIETQTGLSIAALFHRDGEAAFRAMEHQWLTSWLRAITQNDPDVPMVISAGAGALLPRALRHAFLRHTWVIRLHATTPTLVQRLHTQGASHRPLLTDDITERLEALNAARSAVYAESHCTVATDTREPDSIVREIVDTIARLDREHVRIVPLGLRSYNVHIAESLTSAPGVLNRPSEQLLHIADARADKLLCDHRARDNLVRTVSTYMGAARRISFPGRGDRDKSVSTLVRLWNESLALTPTRQSMLVATGGGVATDLTGFVAATLLRGIPYVTLPSTLLAMVDASVGGKTGIDHPMGKNLLGAFHQPSWVGCDLRTLETLPSIHLRAGMAEIAKIALACDHELTSRLFAVPAPVWNESRAKSSSVPAWMLDVIVRSVQAKIDVVARDEHENADRALLNFGHTIGHVIESLTDYTAPHGLCVALGMRAEILVAQQLGITPEHVAARAMQLLDHLDLPRTLRDMGPRVRRVRPVRRGEISDSRVTLLLLNDKKRDTTSLRFVALTDIGRGILHRIELATLRDAVCNVFNR